MLLVRLMTCFPVLTQRAKQPGNIFACVDYISNCVPIYVNAGRRLHVNAADQVQHLSRQQSRIRQDSVCCSLRLAANIKFSLIPLLLACVQTIETLDIECGLLSRVSQKLVATKWRIYRAKLARLRTFCAKANGNGGFIRATFLSNWTLSRDRARILYLISLP